MRIEHATSVPIERSEPHTIGTYVRFDMRASPAASGNPSRTYHKQSAAPQPTSRMRDPADAPCAPTTTRTADAEKGG